MVVADTNKTGNEAADPSHLISDLARETPNPADHHPNGRVAPHAVAAAAVTPNPASSTTANATAEAQKKSEQAGVVSHPLKRPFPNSPVLAKADLPDLSHLEQRKSALSPSSIPTDMPSDPPLAAQGPLPNAKDSETAGVGLTRPTPDATDAAREAATTKTADRPASPPPVYSQENAKDAAPIKVQLDREGTAARTEPEAAPAQAQAPPPVVKSQQDLEWEDELTRYFPDAYREMDYFRLEELDRIHFDWPIDDWAALSNHAKVSSKGRTHSPPFQFMNRTWRILLFPNGDEATSPSVFIEADKKDEPKEWGLLINFGLEIRNTKNPRWRWISSGRHRFCPQQADWGFKTTESNAALRGEVPKGAKTARPPILENNSLIISAHMRAFKDPTGVMWWSRDIAYDSKKVTGYVGLKNQGATCYMNSILQSFFLTPALRKAVFRVPTDQDKDASKSVALALQRVFYNLTYSDDAVDTRELTTSFGWDTAESFMQHDVQEFCRVLLDSLEKKMKGTESEKVLAELFNGKLKSYIRCVNVNFESAREEDFSDVQLNVKGLTGLEASFKDFTQEELMSGDNQYRSDEFGLQDAKKGLIFTQLPRVLHLQLKRLIKEEKINDRWEYPMQVDLASYVDGEAGKSPCMYHLHGVLVHSGDVNGGHYYAFIRPSSSGGWFKFDDDKVSPVMEDDVLENNYGGEAKLPDRFRAHIAQQTSPSAAAAAAAAAASATRHHLKRFCNAYMLIYISEKERDTILADVDEAAIPRHLKERLAEERRAAEEAERRRIEEENSIRVQVITDEVLARHHGPEMLNMKAQFGQPATSAPILQIRKDVSLLSMKQQIADALQRPLPHLRFWFWQLRLNTTIRVQEVLQDEVDETKVDALPTLRESTMHQRKTRVVYVEVGPAPKDHQDAPVEQEKVENGEKEVAMIQPTIFMPNGPDENTVLLFCKAYDPFATTEEGKLSIVGHIFARTNDTLDQLAAHYRALRGDPADATYTIWEEVKMGMVLRFKDNRKDLATSELANGDIVIFMRKVPTAMPISAIEEAEEAGKPLTCESSWDSPAAYIHYLTQRIAVIFRPATSQQQQQQQAISRSSSSMDVSTTPIEERQPSFPPQTPNTNSGGENTMPTTPVTPTALTRSDRISIAFSLSTPYDDLCAALAERIHHPADQIQLKAVQNGEIKHNIPRQTLTSLDMIVPNHAGVVHMAYECLDVSIVDLETKRDVTIIVVDERGREVKTFQETVLKTKDIVDVSNELLSTLEAFRPKLAAKTPRHALAMENHKFTLAIDEHHPVSHLASTPGAALILHYQMPQPEGQKALHVCHFHKMTTQGHGLPFMMFAPIPITIKELKKTIGEWLEWNEAQLERVRLAVVKNNRADYPEDDVVLTEALCDAGSYVGLDYPGRGVRANHVEKSIKIIG